MTQIMTQLTDLLEEERVALVAGALDRLPELRSRKESLLAELEAAPDRTLPAELRELCERNQLLISAALDGTKAALKRMAELRAVQSQLSTYESAGRKQSVPAKPGSLERKA